MAVSLGRRAAELFQRRTLPFLQRFGRTLATLAVAAWSWAAPRMAEGARRLAAWSRSGLGAAWRWAVAVTPPALERAKVVGGRTLVRARAGATVAGRGALAGAGALARGGFMAWPHVRPWFLRVAVAGVTAVVVTGVAVASAPPVLEVAAGVVSDDLAGPSGGLAALEEPSTVVAADGSVLATLQGRVRRRPVALSQVPGHVQDLVVVAEDRSFWSHDGYDPRGMARSLVANLRALEIVQGGSTISQQLAKLNFTGGERSAWRKAEELVYAVALEDRFTKEELLERYLNQVYFGSGAYGIGAAAQGFFGVGPEQLSVAQGALLAAVIPAPVGLDPYRHPEAARAQRDLVLDAAHQAGYLSGPAASAARQEPLVLAPPAPAQPPDPLVATIERELLASPALGPTAAERQERLAVGGLRIETTIDPRLQAIAAEVVADHLPLASPTAAVAAVDPRNGAVRALFGGSAGSFDLAAQGRRQPGSTFKPLVAAAALGSGFSPDKRLEGDGPLELSGPELGQPWEVDNYKSADHGDVDMATALTDSVNTAFAQLTVAVGVGPVVQVLHDVGIDVDAALGPPAERSPVVGLGGVRHGVTALEMAGAYATVGNAGGHHPPYLVARITDAAGHQLALERQPMRQALSPEVNAQLLPLLQDAVAQGTGTAAQLEGRSPAGKTGTTQDNADAWFVGTVPVLSTAVWVGDPAERRRLPGVTGGGTAAPIWADFMSRALEGSPPVAFPTSPQA